MASSSVIPARPDSPVAQPKLPVEKTGHPPEKSFFIRVLLTVWLVARKVFIFIFPVVLWGITKYIAW